MDNGTYRRNKTYAEGDGKIGSVLSFHNLVYEVSVSAGFCKSKGKVIINDVSGIFKPGMNAIMGPTGSGKTSLLDIIAGRKDPNGLKSGHLLVDGNPQPKNYKCMTGYVVQDDVVMGTLTVRENLMFSANVRLASSVSHQEKCDKVEETIKELGLTHCADTKVGTPFIRGVSGGERKRTNIGMELIIAPSVLFLDEPTTGLDASTSYAVLSLLHSIAKKGKTIIFSIHQPRFSIYKLFDSMMLLARGKAVYLGPAPEALQFFSSIGYDCEEHNNPADFFLDVINGDSSAVKAVKENSKNGFGIENPSFPASLENTASYNDNKGNNIIPMDNLKEQNESLADKFFDHFKSSKWHKDLDGEIKPILDDYLQRQENGESVTVEKADYATSVLVQLKYVSKRAFLNLIRNPMASVIQIVLLAFFGVITGLLYFDLADTPNPGILNRYGLFFFLVMNMIFSNMSALEIFINERPIFIHENSSGYYRVSAYFFAKLTCDLLPMRIAPLIPFLIIMYFMTGLTLSASTFFLTFLIMFLVSLTASAICFFYSAAIGIMTIANLVCVLTYVLMMIFGGLLVNLESLWVGIRWLQYLSLFRYGLYALSINEFKGLEFFEYINGTKISVGKAGERFLEEQNIPYESDWDFWQNIMAISILGVFFFIICYIMLRKIKKYK